MAQFQWIATEETSTITCGLILGRDWQVSYALAVTNISLHGHRQCKYVWQSTCRCDVTGRWQGERRRQGICISNLLASNRSIGIQDWHLVSVFTTHPHISNWPKSCSLQLATTAGSFQTAAEKPRHTVTTVNLKCCSGDEKVARRATADVPCLQPLSLHHLS